MVRRGSKSRVGWALAGVLAAASPAVAEDSFAPADLDKPLYSREGMPACVSPNDLAVWIAALKSGHPGATENVRECLLIRDGIAIILVDAVDVDGVELAKVRLIVPKTGRQIERYTLILALRNGAPAPAGPATARRPRAGT